MRGAAAHKTRAMSMMAIENRSGTGDGAQEIRASLRQWSSLRGPGRRPGAVV